MRRRCAAFVLAISLLGRWACSLVYLWLVARVLLRLPLRMLLTRRVAPHRRTALN